MSYKLRFVQNIDQKNKEFFLEIEKKFIEYEKEHNMPQGKRYLPVTGKLPTNTLIWECEFENLEDVTKKLTEIYAHPIHDELLKEQTPFMKDSYCEIYEVFE
jgi:hypothetical protein